jgi:hypothetical protein
MAKCYIVVGMTGEYSDRSEWPVVVLDNEQAAKEYVAALDVQLQKIPQEYKDERWEHEDEMQAIMSLDPSFYMDYTGTGYHIRECEILTAEEVDNKLKNLTRSKMIRNTRMATTKLLELVEDGVLDKDQVIRACVNYMSETDVKDMCEAEGYFDLDEEDE